MFTGIIENMGSVLMVIEQGTNKTFHIHSELAHTFKPDQSVSHNGVCLTVEKVNGDTYQTTAILETLKRSNIGDWKEGTKVNLERSVRADQMLDGHIVQGHVDAKAPCMKARDMDGSWEYTFGLPDDFKHLVVHKGSIAINGVSLTISDLRDDRFSVSIIPYTWEHTNFNQLVEGDEVNLEFDILGKYVQRQLALSKEN